ncbi:InlB B-repeat-containing protein [Butyrivibrio sp. MC2013]|uniref:InlB B-repeat-containing protein n=1 Tax=Butyrivibrio sp. MC2013 TaxID=1280686 RepID=UPI000403E232|nr:MBG domain-containing protein [Butyrivibrio sp. MC2013]
MKRLKKTAPRLITGAFLVLGMLLLGGTKVQAETQNPPVTYLEYDNKGVATEKTITDYQEITENTIEITNGWWVVSQSVSTLNRIKVTGNNVNLIIKDGEYLLARTGINLDEEEILSVYGQTEGTGELEAGMNLAEDVAGIGGNNGRAGGRLNVHGVKLTARGGRQAAGIGGGNRGSLRGFYCYAGEVTAYGRNNSSGYGGAGIGTGAGGHGGTIRIYGGVVKAYGSHGAAALGNGTGGWYGSVSIYGGDVYASGGYQGPGIGGGYGGFRSLSSFYMTGGTVYAKGGGGAAAIGGAPGCSGIDFVTIEGGVLKAEGGPDAPAAFGHGEEEFLNDNTDDSIFEYTDTIAVQTGPSFEDMTFISQQTDAARNAALLSNRYVQVVPCEHEDKTYTKGDAENHNWSCDRCHACGTGRHWAETEDKCICGENLSDIWRFDENGRYLIYTEDHWNMFCDMCRRINTDEKSFLLMNDIFVTRFFGDNISGNFDSWGYYLFRGRFDGGGHTLNVYYDTPGIEGYLAPFLYTDHAEIRNLHVTGRIIHGSGGGYCSGLVARDHNMFTMFNNVRVSTDIYFDGNDDSCGGFVGYSNTTYKWESPFTGCVFDGSIYCDSGKKIAGFVGGGSGEQQRFEDCLFAPYDVLDDNPDSRPFNSKSIPGGFKGCCYYTESPGDGCEGGPVKAYRIFYDPEKIGFAGVPDVTYATSMFKRYGNVVECNGTGYAPEGTVVTLGSDIPGYEFLVNGSSAGVTDNGNGTWSFTMPGESVWIGVRPAPGKDEVSYIDEYGLEYTTEAIALDGSETELFDGWYYTTGDITYDHPVFLAGDIHLILSDGTTISFTQSYSFTIPNKCSRISIDYASLNPDSFAFNTYWQNGKTGALNMYGHMCAEIVNLHGGRITMDTLTAGRFNSLGGIIQIANCVAKDEFNVLGGQFRITYQLNIFMDGYAVVGYTNSDDFFRCYDMFFPENSDDVIKTRLKIRDGQGLCTKRLNSGYWPPNGYWGEQSLGLHNNRGGISGPAHYPHNAKTITYEQPEHGRIYGVRANSVSGTVELNAVPDEHYVLDHFIVRDNGGNELPVTAGKFTMPNSDVTVTAVFKGVDYNITYDVTGPGSLTGPDSACKDDIVSLNSTINPGCRLDSITITDSEGNELEHSGLTFTMPGCDVTVTAVFKMNNYYVTYHGDDHGTVRGMTRAGAGDVISIEILPDPGYELDTLSVKRLNSYEMVVTPDYTFVMPENDVTVYAHFQKSDYTITCSEPENGTVELSAYTAQYGDPVNISATANEGYKVDQYQVNDENGNTITVENGSFSMPAGNVTVTVIFSEGNLYSRVEPYIDENGAYILGTVEHFEEDGKYYAVNEDGTKGDELDSLELSYFDFRYDDAGYTNGEADTYRILYYTGPTDELTELVFPKTYNGKKVVALGDAHVEMFETSQNTPFSIVLNENIIKIRDCAFQHLPVSRLTGNTSRLQTIGINAFTTSAGNDTIEMDLDYEGTVDNRSSSSLKYIFNLKHATSTDVFNAHSKTYNFTDEHTYGEEPEWEWADDYSSATATFTCTNSRCNHKETKDAVIIYGEDDDVRAYIAYVEFGEESFIDDHIINRNKYTVNWVVGGETVETDENVTEGKIPSYNGARPADLSDEVGHRFFAGWSDGENTYTEAELPPLTEDVTYTAVYTAKEAHEFVELQWYWSDDLSDAALALVCDSGGEIETVEAEVSSEITTVPNCTTEGVRTYTATAVFEGQTYTDTRTEALPANDAHALNHHLKTDQTNEDNGNIEYWECIRCEKLFSDEACEHEITAEETVIPRNRKISFVSQTGGSEFAADYVETGEEYELPDCDHAAPNVYLRFKKWSVRIGEAEAVTKAAGDPITVTDDTVVIPVWGSRIEPMPEYKNGLVYTGQLQDLIIPGSVVDSAATLEYAFVKLEEEEPESEDEVLEITLPENAEFSESVPAAKDGGYYAVWFKLAGQNADTAILVGKAATGIAPKPYSVRIDDKRKLVNTEDPEFTVTYTGLADGETTPGFEIAQTDFTRQAGETVGEYEISISDEDRLSNANYTCESVTKGTLSILEELIYTISYNPGDGTGTMDDDHVTASLSGEATILLPDCGFTAPKGQYFTAWQIGDQTYEPGVEVTVTGDTEVTAVYADKYFRVEGIEESYGFTGAQIKPEPEVYFGNDLLRKGTDYTVTYKANKNAGTATVIVTGMGSFQNKITQTFEILPRDINEGEFAVSDVYVKYNRKAQTPKAVLKKNGKALKLNTDYTLSWTNENGEKNKGIKAPGTYVVTVKGTGNYTGEREIEYTIAASDEILMSSVSVSRIKDQTYTGAEIRPEFTVSLKNKPVAAEDYEVIWDEDLVSIGTKKITLVGKGSYIGTKTVTFKITGINVAKATVTIPSKYTYDGTEIKPGGEVDDDDPADMTVTYKASKKAAPTILVKNTDYTISYSKNKNAGTATVTVKGIGKCYGTAKKTFKIVKRDLSKAVINDADEGSGASNFYIEYDEEAAYSKNGAKPAVKVYYRTKDNELEKGKDYKVSYKNNKSLYIAGDPKYERAKKPSIVITGLGNFKLSLAAVNFDITPADIGNVSITAGDVIVKNKAKAAMVTPVLKDGGKKLKAGTDYDKTLVYEYVNAAWVTRVVDGVRTEVKVQADDQVDKTDIVRDGTCIRVTANGINSYFGSVSVEYRVIARGKDISKSSIKIADQMFINEAVILSPADIKIVLNGVTLGTDDYEIVSYSKNNRVGTAKAVFHGLGEYGGTKTATFKIVKSRMAYTIVFNANGGTGKMANQYVTGSVGKLSANTFKRSGYTFDFWSTNPNGTGDRYTDKQVVSSLLQKGKKLVLYANWRENQ